MITKKVVENKLRLVNDPELGINIVDLGLIYDIKVQRNDIFILMTLTFPGCPLGGIIQKEIDEKIGSIKDVGEVKLEITFNPPWDFSRVSKEAKAELGMLN